MEARLYNNCVRKTKWRKSLTAKKAEELKEAATIRKRIHQLQPTVELVTNIEKLKRLCRYPESCPYGWWKCETPKERVRRVE
jgi:hypothetical protein